MFVQKAVMFEWPFGPFAGQTVRFFQHVGPFRVSQWGSEWRVSDIRKANPKGGADWGVKFKSRRQAEQYIVSQVSHV
jgi:hypothetical protein